MPTQTQDDTATAHEVVSHPEKFADQPALREMAWRTLVEARGGKFAARNIPIMTHAEPGRPARGVAAELAARISPAPAAPNLKPAPAFGLEAALASAAPRVTATVQRYLAERAPYLRGPGGGSAA